MQHLVEVLIHQHRHGDSSGKQCSRPAEAFPDVRGLRLVAEQALEQVRRAEHDAVMQQLDDASSQPGAAKRAPDCCPHGALCAQHSCGAPFSEL